jgi:subtilisin family serine protease
LRTVFGIAALVAASAAAPPALGETRTAGRVVVSPRIDPRVRERAQSEPAIPVFIVLEHQPQGEILAQAKATNALYRQVAESRYRQASEPALANVEEVRQAREAADAVVLRTRQQAFQAIEQVVAPEQEALEGRLRGLGATRISRYLGINMLAAEIPATAIAALDADPEIARVFAVEKYAAQLASSVPALGAPAFWNAGYTGQGESVGILDSGIRTNHPAFAGVSFVNHVFLANAATNSCFGDNSSSAEDQHGHGTYVAGVVASRGSPGWTNYQGVAKGLGTLYNLKVAYQYSAACNSMIAQSDSRDVLAALDWAVRNTPVKIFNYSYGNPAPTDDDGFAQAIDQYIDNYGLTITIAAGYCNHFIIGMPQPGALTVNTPGNAYNGITVGSWLDPDSCSGTLPPFNGPGRTKPDLLAPGNNVLSTAHNWDATPGTADDFAYPIGTSAAAPHIAGAVALLGSAGVTNSLAAKAILINGSDQADYSSPRTANLTQTASQLNYLTGTLTANSVPQLYKVHLTGDFRATLAWNRHVIGGTSYLNAVNLALFSNEGAGGSLGGYAWENVKRIIQPLTGDFVAAVVMDSSPMAGVSSEPYAVAFNVPFTPVFGPRLRSVCSLPSPIAPGSRFAMTCDVTNEGDLPALAVAGKLALPGGFSGPTDLDFGTVQAGADSSRLVNLTAPATDGSYAIRWNIRSSPSFFRSPTAEGTATAAVHSALRPPVLVSPANGATGVSTAPTLVWKASSGATSYDIYLGTSLVANTAATTYTTGTLDAGTLFYWRVVAKDGTNSVSSAAWSFATQSAAPGTQQYLLGTVAGSLLSQVSRSDGSPATSVSLSGVMGVTAGAGGRFYFSDTGNSWIRSVAADGTITTIGPSGRCSFTTLPDAPLCAPEGIARDTAGNFYVTDNSRLLKVAPDGSTTRVAGNGVAGYSGDGGPATAAQLNMAIGVALDAAGNILIADLYNFRIRKVTPGGIISTVAGSGEQGTAGDGGPATSAQLEPTYGVAVDAAGDILIADSLRIRKVTPDGTITTVAGGGGTWGSYTGEGGPATSAHLPDPQAVAADGAGNLFIADGQSGLILRVDTRGIITTVAGTDRLAPLPGPGMPVHDGGIGGPALGATLGVPFGVSAASNGEIYIADGSTLVNALVPVDPLCHYQVHPTTVAMDGAGGSLPVSITTQPGCAWTVGSLPWVGSGTAIGKGSGTVSLSVLPNSGTFRSDRFLMAGTAVTVTQADIACTYALGAGGRTVLAAGATGSITVTGGPSCPWVASSPVDWVTLAEPTSGIGGGTVNYTVAPNASGARSGTLSIAGLSFNVQQNSLATTGLGFIPVSPCRVADTRGSGGAMAANETRSFAIPQGGCGIPPTAQAYSLNVTVVPRGPLSYLTLWPTEQAQPLVSTLNSFDGIVVANAAIVPAGFNGAVSVFVTDPTDVILDINGYFDSPGTYAFYPVQPCRVADTRAPAGPFGGPHLTGAQGRDFPVPSSSCGLPATASAYSMNVTVVPEGYLGYLKTWPTGQAQPNVSTLNSWTGKVVANAAIVPAGTGGSISVYAQDPTQVVLDANGYFGAPGGSGSLSFHPVPPCRVADTRRDQGPLGGPKMAASTARSFPMPSSGCGIPATAAAYSLNVTVVPDGMLQYLTVWPTGAGQPFASTLNSWDGTVVANAAIVPAGQGGAISVFVTDRTHVILDINGYFAP